MDAKLFIGQTFESFDQFKQELDCFEKQTKQKFTIKSSRTIKSSYVTHPIKSDLVYYEIQYACVHRKGFKSVGKGIRKSSTIRKSCPAMITLRASKCGEYLTIRKLLENHEGHELSEKVINHLYLNRKPSEAQPQKVQASAALHTKKKKIRSYLFTDGSNTPPSEEGCNGDIKKIITLLNTTYKCNVQVLCDESGIFKSLYFSSAQMRRTMQAWPELIALNSTYTLISDDCTVYILSVEDSNGKSEIVGVSILASEDKDTITFCLNSFKMEHSNIVDRMRCFITDKDFVKRSVIKELFPEVQMYTCLFHTMRSFKREITADKLKITKRERESSLEFIRKLIHSTNADYDVIYSDFKEIAPHVIVDYYDKNWGPIRKEWTVKNMKNNFLNITTNRLESINSKLKQAVGKDKGMLEFIHELFVFLTTQQFERDHLVANYILKTPVCTFKEGSTEYSYQQYLTSYAFEYVLKQINTMQLVAILSQCEEQHYCIKSSSTGKIKTSPFQCECRNYMSLILPCKHILAVRKKCNLNLFNEDLCDVRWSRSYYLEHQRLINNTEANLENNNPVTKKKNKKKLKSLSQKRKQLLAITNSIANVASFSTNTIYEYRIKQLTEIEACWRSGKEISIKGINHNENLSSKDLSIVEDATSEPQVTPAYNVYFDHDYVQNAEIVEVSIPSLEVDNK